MIDKAITAEYDRGRKNFEKRLGLYLNLSPESYSLEQEYEAWHRLFEACGYKLIAESPQYELFERPTK